MVVTVNLLIIDDLLRSGKDNQYLLHDESQPIDSMIKGYLTKSSWLKPW